MFDFIIARDKKGVAPVELMTLISINAVIAAMRDTPVRSRGGIL